MSKNLPFASPLTMCRFVPPVHQPWSEAVDKLSVFPPDRGSQTFAFRVTLGYLKKDKHGYSHDVGGAVALWLVRSSPDRLSGPGSSPGQGHCVMSLGKTLYSHSASLHSGV